MREVFLAIRELRSEMSFLRRGKSFLSEGNDDGRSLS